MAAKLKKGPEIWWQFVPFLHLKHDPLAFLFLLGNYQTESEMHMRISLASVRKKYSSIQDLFLEFLLEM